MTHLNPSEIPHGHLRCYLCGAIKPDAQFPVANNKPGRRYHSGRCHPCNRLIVREWTANNRDRRQQKNLEYRQDHPGYFVKKHRQWLEEQRNPAICKLQIEGTDLYYIFGSVAPQIAVYRQRTLLRKGVHHCLRLQELYTSLLDQLGREPALAFSILENAADDPVVVRARAREVVASVTDGECLNINIEEQ